jgi:lysophospholipase L1-like esterase
MRPNHARHFGRAMVWALPAILLATGCMALAAEPKAAAPAKAPAEFFFHDGDTPIVFLGDSITEQKEYTTFIEAYVLTRFPKWNVTFRNIGWGGDTAWFQQRKNYETGLKRDVLPLKAKAITIDFGMNDARGGDGSYAKYIEYSTRLVADLKAAGVRVALVTPSPEERYEADQPAGSKYNLMLSKYSKGLEEIARKEGVLFVDQLNPFIKVIEDGRKAGLLSATQGNPRLIPDAVHPNWGGHLVMAAAILKGLNAPAIVSRLEIDSAASKVVAAEKCTADILPTERVGILTFRRTDECLPLPISQEAEMVLKVPGFTALDDLSRYELKVTGLKADRYDLAIDGQKTATLTKEELAKGVNLTVLAGPITEQGRKLFKEVIAKNNLYFERWRKVVVPALTASLSEADLPAEAKAKAAELDQKIADKEKEINALRAPAAHVFRLSPAP